MMILLIDAGNSRCKLALYDFINNCFEQLWNIGYDNFQLPQELSSKYHVDKIYIAAVASKERTTFIQNEIYRLKLPAAKEIAIDIDLLYTEYCTLSLGIDRWLAMLALKEQKVENAVVIDIGTAATIDILKQGIHLGGWITPGLQSMKQTLLHSTNIKKSDQSPLLSFKPATNTNDAINNGCILAIVSLVNMIVANVYTDEKAPEIFLTGGDSKDIQGLLNIPTSYRKHLVLEGIKSVVKKTLHY